ncbi:MAG: purine-nucleoside phosphorylase [Cyclobacteriaceae bacterium]|jgi:purine-nucleoside phosphorylase
MVNKLKDTVEYLVKHGMDKPEIGIILGTGLGALADQIKIEYSIPYEEIPYFPLATVEFHKGKLIYGTLSGKKIIAMQGRFHFYEGYSMSEVVFPVRVMREMGVTSLLVSNAAGNMNLNWKKGELMLIDDHINLQPDNPLRGQESAQYGPIFTDMSAPYSSKLNEKLLMLAEKNNIKLNKGIYVAVTGPSLETRAEYRYLRNIGADVVGMSTVPEVIAANQMSLPVCAISVLTDNCDPDNLAPVNIEDIIATAQEAEKELVVLFKGLIEIL